MRVSAPYFFYGTLMDAELLARVIAEPVASGRMEPARLAGYRRSGVVGRSYPVLVPSPGSVVDGVLVRGIGPVAARRLAAYEGANYRTALVTVTDSHGRFLTACAFLFVSVLRPDYRPWRPEIWQRRWKRRTLRRAERLTSRPGWG